jgi:flagellar hook protein FlgE
MGLQSALSTALTGLNAAETIIDVAGNNVANSQTVGFKESGVNFATQFLQTISIGSAPGTGPTSNGGTNPRQIGLGVKVAEIAQDFTQGTIEISSNPLDVAIQGDGFLIVQSGGSQYYTRNGQLKTNQNNEIVTITGDRVMGYNAVNGRIVENLEPLVIPIGGSVAANVTSIAAFSGTLDPASDVGVGRVIESAVLGNARTDYPRTTNFDATDLIETPIVVATGVTSGVAGVAGNLPPGSYSYRISYYDASGETAASDAFTVTQGSATDDNIQLTNLPTAPSPYTGVRVYRAVGTTNTYRLVGDTTTASFTDSTSPSTLASAAELNTDTVGVGSYSYYITFRQSVGQNLETRPSALVGTKSITTAGHRISLKDIPQPTDTSYDQIRIYRSSGTSSSNHYLVDTINAGSTTYTDSLPDTELVTKPEIDLDGVRINSGDKLFDVQLRRGPDYVQLFDEPGTITFTGIKADVPLPPKEFQIDADTTVNEWLEFIGESLGLNSESGVPNAPVISIVNGKVHVESNAGLKNAIDIDPASFSFTAATPGSGPEPISIPFDQTVAAKGAGSSSEFVVYDSLGTPLTVRLTTVLEEKNDNNTVWRWFATSGDNEPSDESSSTVVGTGTIVYDNNGNFDADLSGLRRIIIERSDSSADNLSFNLDFSKTNGKSQGRTQLNFTSQDGFAPGTLSDFSITETGEIRGIYSNGISQTLGQIRMAKFVNNGGLQQVGNNLFAEGVNSGVANFGNPGDDGIGELTAGAVELSNTDIGQNLIDLILASTQYRGGARVITAVQELLDELMALQR